MLSKQSWTTNELCQLPCEKNRTFAGVIRAYHELSMTDGHVAGVCRFAILANSRGGCVCRSRAQSIKEVIAGRAGPGASVDRALGGLAR